MKQLKCNLTFNSFSLTWSKNKTLSCPSRFPFPIPFITYDHLKQEQFIFKMTVCPAKPF